MDRSRPRRMNWYRRLPRWRRALLVAGVLLLLALLSLVSAKPAYRAFREWRIERNAVQARVALQEGRHEEARRLSMAVLRLRKERLDMLQVLRQAMEQLGDPAAPDVARIIMTHPDATEAQWREGFLQTCEHMPTAVVIGTWLQLGPSRQRDPGFSALMARRLIDQGLWQAASEVLRQSSDPGGICDELRLQKARLWLATEGEDGALRGQAEIAGMLRDGGPGALEGFRLLATVPESLFRADTYPDLVAWLDGREGVTTGDRLLALRQAIRRYPSRAQEIIDSAVARHGGGDPAAVATWLLGRGQPERALELVPEEHATRDGDSFRVRRKALAELGRWREIAELLKKPPPEFPSLELKAERVIAADHLSDTPTRTREWSDALRDAAADGSSNAFLELSDRMARAGLKDFAMESMVEAVRLGRGCLPLYEQVRGLLPWLRERRRGFLMLECCSTFAKLEPGNPDVFSDFLYLGCIFGKIVPSTAAAGFHELLAKRPDQPGAHLGLATALLLDGKPAEALRAMGEAPEEGPPDLRESAVQAVAFAMLGKEEESKDLLDRLDWQRLLPEERDACLRLLSRTKLAGEVEQAKIRGLTGEKKPPERPVTPP